MWKKTAIVTEMSFLYLSYSSFILQPDINSQRGENIVSGQLNRTLKVLWTRLCLLFRMLYHYLDHKRKESSAQIHATYLVSGKSVDDGQTVRTITNHHTEAELHGNVCSCWWAVSPQGHRVSVVREDQLEGVKTWFSVAVVIFIVFIFCCSWSRKLKYRLVFMFCRS